MISLPEIARIPYRISKNHNFQGFSFKIMIFNDLTLRTPIANDLTLKTSIFNDLTLRTPILNDLTLLKNTIYQISTI